MANRFKVIDQNDTIHSGTESEMLLAFHVMQWDIDRIRQHYQVTKRTAQKYIKDYKCTFTGDVELVEVIAIF